MVEGLIAIKEKQWRVSVATTPQEFSQGLGGLESIPAGTGMLFDLGYSQPVQVTTYPMLFPVDIAFISDNLVITQIERNVSPGTLMNSETPARFWLEVNGGELSDAEVGDGVLMPEYPSMPEYPWMPQQDPIIQALSTLNNFVGSLIPLAVMGSMGKTYAQSITPARCTSYTPEELKAIEMYPQRDWLPPAERARLEREYGTWAVERAQAMIPSGAGIPAVEAAAKHMYGRYQATIGVAPTVAPVKRRVPRAPRAALTTEEMRTLVEDARIFQGTSVGHKWPSVEDIRTWAEDRFGKTISAEDAGVILERAKAGATV